MATFADVRVASPPSLARRAGGLVRWLCTSNPFYVLSAALFLGGLWVSFGTLENVDHIWGLMAGLAGYTLLLAVTACLLVRFGNVWDDVRTVLLLVVLMFLATSVTFDMILAFRDNEGMTFYLAGLVFAIGVSEALLHGIRLRLPALFRIPYYLILALFFLYPLALNPFLRQPDSDVMRWGLFGFSSITAYPPAMAAIILMYGLLLRHWPSMLVSGMVLVCWLVVTGWGGYSTLRKAIRGLDWMAVSLVVFVLAVLTSLAKSGLLAQLWKRCQVLLACGWKRPAAEMSRR